MQYLSHFSADKFFWFHFSPHRKCVNRNKTCHPTIHSELKLQQNRLCDITALIASEQISQQNHIQNFATSKICPHLTDNVRSVREKYQVWLHYWGKIRFDQTWNDLVIVYMKWLISNDPSLERSFFQFPRQEQEFLSFNLGLRGHKRIKI